MNFYKEICLCFNEVAYNIAVLNTKIDLCLFIFLFVIWSCNALFV